MELKEILRKSDVNNLLKACGMKHFPLKKEDEKGGEADVDAKKKKKKEKKGEEEED